MEESIRKVVTTNSILFNLDCFDVFDDIADNSVDMVLVDPPYGTTGCQH